MSGKPTRQSKQLIIILKSFIQRSNQTAVGSREPSRWKRETGRWVGKKKKDRDERNHNRMRSSEGWRFGGRANENARDWLWEELFAWAAKSISFIWVPWSWYRWHTPPPWHILQRPAEDSGSGPSNPQHQFYSKSIYPDQNWWAEETKKLWFCLTVLKTFITTFSDIFKSAKAECAGRTYTEFFSSLKLGQDIFSNVVLRDAQVLPDVAVVAHQGHVAVDDVDHLRQRHSNTGAHHTTTTLAFGEEPCPCPELLGTPTGLQRRGQAALRHRDVSFCSSPSAPSSLPITLLAARLYGPFQTLTFCISNHSCF